MAEHNALKYAAQSITRGVKRAFGLDEHEDAITRLSETLYVVADLWRLPEWAYLRNERLWCISATQGASVGNFSSTGICNPTGSNLVVVVDRIEIVSPNASTYSIRLQANSAAGGVPEQLDTRIPSLTSPLIATQSLLNASVAPGPGTLVAKYTPGSSPAINPIQVGIVLVPGFTMWFTDETTNQASSTNIWGRERPAYPGELLT